MTTPEPKKKKSSAPHGPSNSERHHTEAKIMFFCDPDVTLGTVAETLQISIHTLRDWSRKGGWHELRNEFIRNNADPLLKKCNVLNRKNSYRQLWAELEHEQEVLTDPLRKASKQERDEAKRRVTEALQRMRQAGITSKAAGMKLPAFQFDYHIEDERRI